METRMTLTLDKATHTYHDENGLPYVSVTTLLGAEAPFDGPAIAAKVIAMPSSKYFRWTVEQCLDYWKQSADLGTKLHDDIEQWIKTGVLPDDTSGKVTHFDGVRHFADGKWKGKLHSEKIVHDESLRLAGTVDVSEELEAYDIIHDVKTCRSMNGDKLLKYSMQLELYRRMHETVTGRPCRTGVIIWYEGFMEDPSVPPKSLRPLNVGNLVDGVLAGWSLALNLAKGLIQR